MLHNNILKYGKIVSIFTESEFPHIWKIVHQFPQIWEDCVEFAKFESSQIREDCISISLNTGRLYQFSENLNFPIFGKIVDQFPCIWEDCEHI